MRIDILTLFPEVFEPFLESSIVGRARRAGLVSIGCTNIRDFTHDKHRTVDDRPFGGGPGMVMMCGPVFEAVEHIEGSRAETSTRVLLSPRGEPLTQSIVETLARETWLVFLCGHYEGFDERIHEGLGSREISIGDYVLSGGEPAAMVLVDAIVRLLPGALGDDESAGCDSFSMGMLEYPQYTRPREFRGMTVPEILLSGDHQAVAAWREEQARRITAERRPDLLRGHAESED
ncbi:MAG: tRNA (guanosine(37)-N1)-methyltransferase TrmD [Phycisphaerae bacterium]|nr:tRNA (guanosine(37)-N1)-methyltransferase TrmD [Phycisphaerae bacterium]